tara:strand:+ start:123 stop:773 length:651 start_codon:yes stop_codon:yes gene_type:complete
MQRSNSMDSGITALRRRRNTNAYSAFYQIKADRARQRNQNNNKETDSSSLQKILRDRISAQTEGVMNVKVFFKTVLYEIPPLPIALLLCCLIDGYTTAHNRGLAPPTMTLKGLFIWLFFAFVVALPYIAVVLAFYLKTPTETEWSLIEPLVRFNLFLDPNTIAVEHVLTSCSRIQLSSLSSSSLSSSSLFLFSYSIIFFIVVFFIVLFFYRHWIIH